MCPQSAFHIPCSPVLLETCPAFGSLLTEICREMSRGTFWVFSYASGCERFCTYSGAVVSSASPCVCCLVHGAAIFLCSINQLNLISYLSV